MTRIARATARRRDHRALLQLRRRRDLRRPRRWALSTMLEVNAPVIDYAGSRKQLIDRAAAASSRCGAGASGSARHADADRHAERGASCRPDTPPAKIVVLEWGADTERFRPDAAGIAARSSGRPGVVGRVRGRLPELARRGAAGRRDASSCTSAGTGALGGADRRRSGTAGGPGAKPRTCPVSVFTGAVPHDAMPACLAAADIGVAPFDVGAHAPLALGFYWSPLKIFEYMASGLPVVAPAIPRISALVANGRGRHALRCGGVQSGRPGGRARPAGGVAIGTRATRRARPRARRPRVQLDGPLPGTRRCASKGAHA